MSGEWLKFEANTPEKQEVFNMTVALGWDDPDLTVGKLLKVWRWFDQQTIAGNAPGVTCALLDRISGVTGFAEAMCNVGWLEQSDDGLRLPNFDRHNGKTAKERCLTAKRVANHKANAGANAQTVSEPLPRKEKKREEVKTPHTPQAGLVRKSLNAISLKAYLEQCKAAATKPIPEDDSVFDYADKVGLSKEFLRLQWLEFKDRYGMDGAKRYKAWPSVFGKSVRGNWFKLWYIGNEGYALTTVGQQAKRQHGDTL